MTEQFLGKYCIVRTRSAGVFAGICQDLDGMQGVVADARRIWYWAGAASLSQLATDGTSKPNQCKFPTAVSEVYLSEVIEVIHCTKRAEESIRNVPVWEC